MRERLGFHEDHTDWGEGNHSLLEVWIWELCTDLKDAEEEGTGFQA